MSRLIDADDMIDRYIKQGSIYDTSDLEEMLHYMPTIDAVPVKHGKWVHCEGDDYWEWTCSACMKNSEIHGEQLNYCPNCGAKMDKKEKEE